MIGFTFFIHGIHHHIGQGDHLFNVPSGCREIGSQLFAGQFHLRVVHAHVAGVNHLPVDIAV